MLKVVVVVDKEKTAIDRLAQGVARYHGNLDFSVVAVHPKRPDEQQLERFVSEALQADIIDFAYYKSALMLLERYPWLQEKKKILQIHNPYCLEDASWDGFDAVVANNHDIYERLGKLTTAPVEYIPNTIDTDFWTFNTEWEPKRNIVMVANRIEGKKGILPVAIACADLGLHFILVGSISDQNYFYDVMQTGPVDYREKISDEQLRQIYQDSTIHVCNSVDNFESGPIPVVEAMMCGTPVLTRKVGHIPELFNGQNMVIQDSDPEDVVRITELLREMMMDKSKLKELRDSGWQTAKSRSNERRAYMYQKLYREVLYPNDRTVSVVVPVYDKPEIMRKCLDALARQTYRNIELIVADDNPTGENKRVVDEYAQYVSFPVRYIHTANGNNDYGLARARNIATIEATGEIMVYIDQRQIPNEDCIEEFVRNIKPKNALLLKI
jgi:glycosyltransferase involved in cell wall biosynthesis